MRFLIDADLPNRAADVAFEFGHDALLSRRVLTASASDDEVAASAAANQRCLITGDFDFADLRIFDPRRYAGIVVLTLPRGADTSYVEELLRKFFGRLEELLPLEGHLFVVSRDRIRVR